MATKNDLGKASFQFLIGKIMTRFPYAIVRGDGIVSIPHR